MEAAKHGTVQEPTGYVPETPSKFVMTHHDLAPRNLLVDPAGQLWLLDWDLAGWYPRYFEYAAMQNFQVPPHWNWLALLRWRLFTSCTVPVH
ncbi:MAG: hypothetical protein M1832_003748 [Thelocarpon impressellum]|nr:MAG: hypothetical protein M1832_003748 [Thelocarpon impressellum]